MSEEKHEQEAQIAQAKDDTVTKQEIIKDDGRRLIFYTFPAPDLKDKD